jgi:transcriptional regulator with XRE-family HTH domain
MKKIGEKIAKLRELKNFRQEYMADKLKIQQAAYSAIETGKTDIKYSQLEKISEILEIDLAKLIGFDEKTVFNVTNDMSNNNGENQTGLVVQNSTNTEKQLYEQMLVMQKERIMFLENLIKTHLKVEV